MQGRKDIQPKIMYQVNLNDLVPTDNFYRRLDQVLDLSFPTKATQPYYGKEGQDPIVFFKICLIGYLNNINSDRYLIAFCANCLDVRLYLKYDLDEALPWHSTISRTRQLYGEEVFLSLFQKVLSLCIAQKEWYGASDKLLTVPISRRTLVWLWSSYKVQEDRGQCR